jgi:predicted SAM-dependent methyltransferase
MIGAASDQEFDGRAAVLRIARRYGELGNNFYQLLHAVVIARNLGCVELQIPKMQGVAEEFPINTNCIRITSTPTSPDSRPTLVGVFFAPYGFERFFRGADLAFIEESMLLSVRPLYEHILSKVRPLAPDLLCMHFRGGDVFRAGGKVHPWYVQPPASYYISAFEYARERLGVVGVQLVFQDRANPAVGVLEQYLSDRGVPFVLQSGDLATDLRCLSGAHHLVAPYGTFCEAIAMMSEHCRSYFGFRSFASQYDMTGLLQSRVDGMLRHRGVRTILVENPDQTYTQPRTWKASTEQLDLICAFPGNRLRISEIGVPGRQNSAATDEPLGAYPKVEAGTGLPASASRPFGDVTMSQSSKKRIFDCFIFFNELDLLDMRFEESFEYVDYFVICEATKTFRGAAKPLVFEQNKQRYARYLSKVRHIVVDDMPEGEASQREYYQRNALRRGVSDATPDDVVIISDCDELIRRETLRYLRDHRGYFMLDMPMYQFFLNMRAVAEGWNKAYAFTYSLNDKVGDYNDGRRRSEEVFQRFPGINHRVPAAGWHFTFLGGAERVVEKIRAYSHAETWQQRMLQPGGAQFQMLMLKDVGGGRFLEYCEIDTSFPEAVRRRQKELTEQSFIKDARSRISELRTVVAQFERDRNLLSARNRYLETEVDRLTSKHVTETNIAFGKPSTQSSISRWSMGKTKEEDARGGNDGAIREPGGYGFHTDRELNPWWQVDLGDRYAVNEIRIFNRKGPTADRLRHFTVLKSDDSSNWEQLFQKSDNIVFSETPYVIRLDPTEGARFIRVRLDGDNCLHFDQCLVYGLRDKGQFAEDRSRGAVAGTIAQYLAGTPPFKLEIGHPRIPKSGWLSVDQGLASAAAGIPAPNNSFDYVRSEHTIQCMPFQSGLGMLRECHRILKPGGVLRVTTPSVDALRQMISPGHSPLHEKYMDWSVRSSVPGAPAVTSAMFLNNFMRNWGHVFIYDVVTLRLILQTAGFDSIVESVVGESDHEQLRGLEDEARLPTGYLRLESMALEGTKRA